MTILAVSTDKKTRERMLAAAKAYAPAALLVACESADDALYELDTREIAAILTVPKERGFDGLTFARTVHDRAPATVVIFLSEKADDAVRAFHSRASGYLVKPDEAAIRAELADLGIGGNLRPVLAEAKTFGNFDLFIDHRPVKFSRAKSKELFAYLVYRRGTGVSASELIVNLWEDKDVDRTTRSMFHNLLSDLRKSLADAGAEHLLLCERNCYRVAAEALSCDYFDYVDGRKGAENLYTGDFMYGYEWAEVACGDLDTIRYARAGVRG